MRSRVATKPSISVTDLRAQLLNCDRWLLMPTSGLQNLIRCGSGRLGSGSRRGRSPRKSNRMIGKSSCANHAINTPNHPNRCPAIENHFESPKITLENATGFRANNCPTSPTESRQKTGGRRLPISILGHAGCANGRNRGLRSRICRFCRQDNR